MTNPYLSEGNIDELGRLPWLYHVTAAASLSDISDAGGLTSTRRRGPRSGRWGANEDLGSDLVCLSMVPNWGFINSQFPNIEIAILEFDAYRVASLPNARVLPLNSAERDARPFMTMPAEDRAQVVSDCTGDYASKLKAEVLVPRVVPCEFLHRILFFDTWAQSDWRANGRTHKPHVLDGVAKTKFPPEYLSTRPRPA